MAPACRLETHGISHMESQQQVSHLCNHMHGAIPIVMNEHNVYLLLHLIHHTCRCADFSVTFCDQFVHLCTTVKLLLSIAVYSTIAIVIH